MKRSFSFIRKALSPPILYDSIKTALVVGLLLNLINNGQTLYAFGQAIFHLIRQGQASFNVKETGVNWNNFYSIFLCHFAFQHTPVQKAHSHNVSPG
ncbi:hypothetical protein AU255_06250 [Methyloprofundus sedimenti]|uniref:Uncharacterized protein n=1 Tax=Methyloprofundus sedimenti TaxID=1420851 RepID=A0A1V8M7F5_9GAMM|nr:hypothetical protein AU255_06250 [Methyloprofundus sedimenti]